MSPAEIQSALDVAQAVGDDHIQQRSGAGVDSDSWTHSSSEQRMRWFATGMESDSLTACNTLSVPEVPCPDEGARVLRKAIVGLPYPGKSLGLGRTDTLESCESPRSPT